MGELRELQTEQAIDDPYWQCPFRTGPPTCCRARVTSRCRTTRGYLCLLFEPATAQRPRGPLHPTLYESLQLSLPRLRLPTGCGSFRTPHASGEMHSFDCLPCNTQAWPRPGPKASEYQAVCEVLVEPTLCIGGTRLLVGH